VLFFSSVIVLYSYKYQEIAHIFLGNENVAQKDINSQKLKQVRAVIIISQTSTEIATVE
jgi:hypothetical protein